MSEQTGVAAALEEDGGPRIGDQTAADHPEQLQLIGQMAEQEAAEMAAPFGLTLPDGSRPGRPKGSRNKSTEQVKQVIRRLGGDPQMALARIVAGGPAFLMRIAQAAHLEAYGGETDGAGRPLKPAKDGEDGPQVLEPMDATEATRLWMRSAETLAPYMMGKAPIRVEVDGDGLSVNIFSAAIDAAGPDLGGTADEASGGYSIPTKSGTCEDDDEEVADKKSPALPKPAENGGV